MAHSLIRISGTAASLAALSVVGANPAAAGPLDPPAGPVAPTMKPLDAIEPRICINDLPGSAGALHVITEPGNYFLRADITGEPGMHAIHIDLRGHAGNACPSCRPVRCNLNGFALIGVPGSDDAIHVSGDLDNEETVVILGAEDGARAPGSSIIGWGGDGLEFDAVEDVTVNGLSVLDCAGDGMRVAGAAQRERVKCFTSHFRCDLSGIVIVPPLAGHNDIHIADTDSSGNGQHGLDIAFDSAAGAGEGGSTRITLDSPIFADNGGDGLRAVRDNRRHSVSIRSHSMDASRNVGDGLRVRGETLDLDESRDESISLDGLIASDNGGVGARITNYIARLTRCITRRNGADGMHMRHASVDMERCVSADNIDNGAVAFASRVSMRESRFSANGTGAAGGAGLVLDGAPADAGAHTLHDVSASGNEGPGIHLVNTECPTRCTDLLLTGNAADGLREESLVGLGTGAVHVYRCIAQDNAGDGLARLAAVGGAVTDSTASRNGNVGIRIPGGSEIAVVRNFFSGNTQGAVAGQGNLVGPVVDPTTLATNTNPHANLAQ